MSHGWWVPASAPRTVEQRIVEGAARLPSYGAVNGWAALRWLGATWFEGDDHTHMPEDVPLAIGHPHAIRPSRGVTISQEILPPATIRQVHGLRVVGPPWAVAHEMRKARTDEAAVVAFEMAAFHDLVSTAELAELVATGLWIRQGVPRIRQLLPQLEENSWSPMEPVMRLAWIAEGCPRPLANRPVFTREGRFVGTPDVLDPEAGVYGLYDGGLHLAGDVRHADVAKEAAFRSLGLEGVTMMAGDLRDRDPFAVRLRAAYARAAKRPAEDRLWHPGLPSWWVPTFTVEQRRALTAAQRAMYLRYRPAA